MAESEINLKTLKFAVDSVLDHLMEDLGLENVPIDKDYYWDCPAREMYDMSATPTGDHLTVGSLADDMEVHTVGPTRRECGRLY